MRGTDGGEGRSMSWRLGWSELLEVCHCSGRRHCGSCLSCFRIALGGCGGCYVELSGAGAVALRGWRRRRSCCPASSNGCLEASEGGRSGVRKNARTLLSIFGHSRCLFEAERFCWQLASWRARRTGYHCRCCGMVILRLFRGGAFSHLQSDLGQLGCRMSSGSNLSSICRHDSALVERIPPHGRD